jgi:hypothetical protein
VFQGSNTISDINMVLVVPETNESMTAVGSVCSLQRTDIWSFGCVLSRAATWITRGFLGIQQFQDSRQKAASRARPARGRCFHDGTDVLPEVRSWHNYLQRNIPHSDKITGPLLDLIDQHLLRTDRNVRPSASLLYDQLVRILQRVDMETPGITTQLLIAEQETR